MCMKYYATNIVERGGQSLSISSRLYEVQQEMERLLSIIGRV